MNKTQREKDMGISYDEFEKITRLLKDTPSAVNTETKKKIHERGFVKSFYEEVDKKNIALPADMYLKDKKGNTSKLIKNIYGMRVLLDRQRNNKGAVLSPEKQPTEETGKHIVSKADISLYTIENNIRKDIAWISHKKDKIHLQYADVSSDNYHSNDYKEVRDFKEKMVKLSVKLKEDPNNTNYCWPSGKNNKTITIWDNIKSENLKNKAIFGVDYTPNGRFSRHNINIIMSGNSILEKNSDAIYLTSSVTSILHGKANELPPDEDVVIIAYGKNDFKDKTTIGKNMIYGVRTWLIRRSYIQNKDATINNVLNDPEKYITKSCSHLKTSKNINYNLTPSKAPQFGTTRRQPKPEKQPQDKKEKQIKGIQTNLKINTYNVFLDDKLKNPYAAFYYINNSNSRRQVPYNVIKDNDSYMAVLKKYKLNVIPPGKTINPKSGRFIDNRTNKTVKSRSISAFYKRKNDTISPKRSPTPIRNMSPSSPLPKLLSQTLPKLPNSPVRSPIPVRNMSDINTGFNYIGKLGNRMVKSRIFYMPKAKKFYYKLQTGEKKQIFNSEIPKYIPANALRQFT